MPSLRKIFFRFWILNRQILVQTECFLCRLPKAGLNAVLGIGEGQNAKHWQFVRPCNAKRRRRPCLNCPDFAE